MIQTCFTLDILWDNPTRFPTGSENKLFIKIFLRCRLFWLKMDHFLTEKTQYFRIFRIYRTGNRTGNGKTHLRFELPERVMSCCQILWKLCKMWHNSWMSIWKWFHHRLHRLNRKWTGSWTGFCFWWASRAWWNTWRWVVTASWRSNVFSRFFAIAIAISKKIWNWKTEIWFLWFTWWCVNDFNVNLNIIFRVSSKFSSKNWLK